LTGVWNRKKEKELIRVSLYIKKPSLTKFTKYLKVGGKASLWDISLTRPSISGDKVGRVVK